jgi:NYN domain
VGSLSVFVDAGYLFKQGAAAVIGQPLARHELVFYAQAFVAELTEWVCRHYPDDDLLRTYWYDGARRGVPSPDQLDVAALSFVKLRLGRINAAGQQKGVDTLIVRDLMVLSQERSINRAVVLSGDEDLREGIAYAQDRGVRVAVVGIEADGDRSQSIELVREADESLTLPPEIVEGALSRVTLPGAGEEPPAAGPEGAADTRFQSIAEQFARDWMARATPSEVSALIEDRPRIPRELDSHLLQYAAKVVGVFMIGEDDRWLLRAAFWKAVDATEPPQ